MPLFRKGIFPFFLLSTNFAEEPFIFPIYLHWLNLLDMTAPLQPKILPNISYNAIAKLLVMLFQAFANIILSRLLDSSDYGIVGFASIFITFLAQFDDMGINAAFIHKHDIDDASIDTAFTIKIILAIVLFLISFFAAPVFAFTFDNAAVVNVIRYLSLTFLLSSASFIPKVLLTRELNFKTISLINIVASVAQYCLAILLAFNGYKYWSIVAGGLISSMVLALLTNYFRPQRIRFHLNINIAKGFLRYGSQLILTGLVIFAVSNADNFIVASAKGATFLGYYVIAVTWGTQISALIRSIVHSVLFPAFSRIQDNFPLMKYSYLKTLEYVCVIATAVNIVLFIVAKDFLVLLLGHNSAKWLPALITFKIFCLAGIVRAVIEPIGNVIMAIGQPQVLFKSNALAAFLEVCLAYPAIKHLGIEGVALVSLVSYCLQVVILYPFVKKTLQVTAMELLNIVLPSILPVMFLLFFPYIFEHCFSDVNVLVFVSKISIVAICYILVFCILDKWKLLNEALSYLRAI